MADKKISDLDAVALTGAEEVEVLQSGDNVRCTTQDIADLGSGGGGTQLVAARVQDDGTLTSGVNIASVVREGTGQYLITTSISLTSPAGIPVASIANDAGSIAVVNTSSDPGAGTTQFRVFTKNTVGTAQDHEFTVIAG